MSHTARGVHSWTQDHFKPSQNTKWFRQKRYWYCEDPKYADTVVGVIGGTTIGPGGKKRTIFVESGNHKSTYYAATHHGMGTCQSCKIVSKEHWDFLITVLTLKGAKRYEMKNFNGWKKIMLVEQ